MKPSGRGRPPLPERKRLSQMAGVRVTPTEHKLLKRSARKLRISMSQLIRQHLFGDEA